MRITCRNCDSYYLVFWLDEYSEPKTSVYYCCYCGHPLVVSFPPSRDSQERSEDAIPKS